MASWIHVAKIGGNHRARAWRACNRMSVDGCRAWTPRTHMSSVRKCRQHDRRGVEKQDQERAHHYTQVSPDIGLGVTSSCLEQRSRLHKIDVAIDNDPGEAALSCVSHGLSDTSHLCLPSLKRRLTHGTARGCRMRSQRPGPVSRAIWILFSDARTNPTMRSHFAGCPSQSFFSGTGV